MINPIKNFFLQYETKYDRIYYDKKEESHNMSNDKKKPGLHTDITIVVIIAVIIVAVSAVVLIKNYSDKSEKEKINKEFSEAVDKKLRSDAEKADEIRGGVDKSFAGMYMNNSSDGDMSSIELCDDMTVKASGQSQNGWWSSLKKGGVDYISIGFPEDTNPVIYQIYNDYLIDTRSVYSGKIGTDEHFNSVLTSSDGKMVLTLKDDGKADGVYTDDGENTIPIAYSGSYNVHDDKISITLGGDTSEFLMYDYHISDTGTDSGIAAVYYEKQTARED